jgi:hypothetical protein
VIKVIDHPLPPWIERTAHEQFHRFPMEYGHRTTNDSSEFFGRTLYNRITGVAVDPPVFVQNLCDYIRHQLISHMDPTAEFLNFERVVVNGQAGGQAAGRHCDYDHDPCYWTAVYFLQGNSGDLQFYPTQQLGTVAWQQHRLVVFNSGIEHQALAPEMGDWRMSIGISWRMTSQLNPE